METSIFASTPMLWLFMNMFLLTSSTTLYNSTDQDSLLSFKNAITSDPLGVLTSNWSASTPVCGWTGVSCSLRHGRVTALRLSGFKLRGTIAPHLGNLTFLQSLDLSNNNFTGSIPPELCNLRRLKELNVGSNKLSGDIPGGILNNMSSLVVIDMSINDQLTGELPDDVCSGESPKLRLLDLTDNQLSGRIPVGMCRCRMMEELKLSDNKFIGNIPMEIGNLTMLKIFYIYLNNIEGEIPSSIFNISSLERVDLSHNSVSGSFPVFYNSLNLKDLYLKENNFTGNIPKDIGCLTSLKSLGIATNNLTGLIPKQVGNLTSLITLDLAFNKLSGELPEEIGNLVYLEFFGAHNNELLNGSIPSSIFNISTLKVVALMENQFSGHLPPNMGFSLSNLERLLLYGNKLSGEIPTSIANASKLTLLELHQNSFTGYIPDFGNLRHLQALRLWENNLTGEESPTQELRFLSSLTNCRDLEALEISDNPHMSGVLPASIGNLSTSLETFRASYCSIRGVIPSAIGNLSSLQALSLSVNNLTGFIPATIGKLKQVVVLFLSGNQLEGYIPHDLCQMNKLWKLYLRNNLLAGSIPECLGEVKSLGEVSFALNKLNSSLPSKFLNLVGLRYLELSSNYLSGHLPSQIGALKVMNVLDLSSNKFSGNIPDSIGSCQSLEYLYLSDNMFNGKIPQSLGDLKGLLALDLCNNDLSGLIPKSLEKLNLELFNVSYNQLEGEIPDGGCFAEFNATSFLNNSALCGTKRFQVSPCRENHGRSTSKSVSLVMKYILPALTFAAVMILAAVAVALIRRCKRKNTPPAVETLTVSVGLMRISEREVIQGTDSFSEANLLGKGSIGSVYRATLANGEDVAVKVFNLQVEGAARIFDTESQILSSIRHRNLVKVLGYCVEEYTKFKALILAYMPNGSLEMWLHSEKYSLDLVQRLKIAIDVALALEYLHHDHTYTVVHRDIKPSNVLLDADMTAHVGDFSIAKLFDNGKAEVHTKSMATFGYAAPEIGEGKVSTSGDVYSYGILLLEMFTGKRPTDDMFDAEMSIKDWVEKALKEARISEIVAPGLVSREDPQFHGKMRCVSSIFELAMRCSSFFPQKRLDMMQVVVDLNKIKFPEEEVKKKR